MKAFQGWVEKAEMRLIITMVSAVMHLITMYTRKRRPSSKVTTGPETPAAENSVSVEPAPNVDDSSPLPKETDATLPEETDQRWTVYWFVMDGGRAVVGAPSDKPLEEIIPDNRELRYGYILAQDLSRGEAYKLVEDIRSQG